MSAVHITPRNITISLRWMEVEYQGYQTAATATEKVSLVHFLEARHAPFSKQMFCSVALCDIEDNSSYSTY